MTSSSAWISAFRLRTLPLAFSGWLVGIAVASRYAAIQWTPAVLTLLTAFLLQILSNLANDYGDAVSGVDSDERDGPQRMVQSGAISKRAMGRAVILFSALSLLSGCFLLFVVFSEEYLNALIFLLIGLLGILAAIKYTVGKNPYGYAGFGDVFVFVFFGVVLVFGTFYLQTKTFDWKTLLPAASLGLLSIGVLNVNNIRDIESDRISGKNSIPVRIGRKRAVIYHGALLIGALMLTLAYSIQTFSSWAQFIFFPVIVLFVINMKAVSSRPLKELDPFLKQMALATLLFSVLFSVGLLVGSI